MSPHPDAVLAAGLVEWGVAGRPMAGELESGDLQVVAPFPGGVLVAAIDGLGHGDRAAFAARRAGSVLAAEAARPVRALMESCDAALRDTRGAVLTIASIDAVRGQLTWIGIGNVDAVLWRADSGAGRIHEAIVPRNGVVGYQLPPMREATLSILRGDMLVFATDGVRHGFASDPPLPATAQEHADHVLRTHGKTTDDALVLVVKYLGARS
jgi:negative regulator of sigma-B (phosphoserine phosphatase)